MVAHAPPPSPTRPSPFRRIPLPLALVGLLALGTLPLAVWRGLPLLWQWFGPWLAAFWLNPDPLVVTYKLLLLGAVTGGVVFLAFGHPWLRRQRRRRHEAALAAEQARQASCQTLLLVHGSVAEGQARQQPILEQTSHCLKAFLNRPGAPEGMGKSWGLIPWAYFNAIAFAKDTWEGAVAARRSEEERAKDAYQRFLASWPVAFALGLNVLGKGRGFSGLSCQHVWGHWLTPHTLNGQDVSWWDVLVVDPVAAASPPAEEVAAAETGADPAAAPAAAPPQLEELGQRCLSPVATAKGAQGCAVLLEEAGAAVTDAALVAGQAAVTLTLPDGRLWPAPVLLQSPSLGLAVLQAAQDGDAPSLPAGDPAQLQEGDPVFVVRGPAPHIQVEAAKFLGRSWAPDGTVTALRIAGPPHDGTSGLVCNAAGQVLGVASGRDGHVVPLTVLSDLVAAAS